MADRAAVLAAIDEVYRLRVAGDKAELLAQFAPDAQFRLAGAAQLMPGVATGPDAARSAVGALVDTFHFHKIERVEAIIDGDKAAIRTRATVSRPGGEKFETETCDLWTMGEDGKPASIVQFVDTALVARMMV